IIIKDAYIQKTKKTLSEFVYKLSRRKFTIGVGKYVNRKELLPFVDFRGRVADDEESVIVRFHVRTLTQSPADADRKFRFFKLGLRPSFEAYTENTGEDLDFVVDMSPEDADRWELRLTGREARPEIANPDPSRGARLAVRGARRVAFSPGVVGAVSMPGRERLRFDEATIHGLLDASFGSEDLADVEVLFNDDERLILRTADGRWTVIRLGNRGAAGPLAPRPIVLTGMLDSKDRGLLGPDAASGSLKRAGLFKEPHYLLAWIAAKLVPLLHSRGFWSLQIEFDTDHEKQLFWGYGMTLMEETAVDIQKAGPVTREYLQYNLLHRSHAYPPPVDAANEAVPAAEFNIRMSPDALFAPPDVPRVGGEVSEADLRGLLDVSFSESREHDVVVMVNEPGCLILRTGDENWVVLRAENKRSGQEPGIVWFSGVPDRRNRDRLGIGPVIKRDQSPGLFDNRRHLLGWIIAKLDPFLRSRGFSILIARAGAGERPLFEDIGFENNGFEGEPYVQRNIDVTPGARLAAGEGANRFAGGMRVRSFRIIGMAVGAFIRQRRELQKHFLHAIAGQSGVGRLFTSENSRYRLSYEKFDLSWKTRDDRFVAVRLRRKPGSGEGGERAYVLGPTRSLLGVEREWISFEIEPGTPDSRIAGLARDALAREMIEDIRALLVVRKKYLLKRAETWALFGVLNDQRVHEDIRLGVRNLLVEANYRLIYSSLGRVKIDPWDRYRDDAEEDASFGLLRAVETFQRERGCQFSTYASHCMINEIYRGQARRQRRRSQADYAPTTSAWDGLADRHPEIEEAAIWAEDLSEMNSRFVYLDRREQIIVKMRHGIGTSWGQIYTLKELGDLFGFSKARVKQLEMRAMEVLGGGPALDQRMHQSGGRRRRARVYGDHADVFLAEALGRKVLGRKVLGPKVLEANLEELLSLGLEELTRRFGKPEWDALAELRAGPSAGQTWRRLSGNPNVKAVLLALLGDQPDQRGKVKFAFDSGFAQGGEDTRVSAEIRALGGNLWLRDAEGAIRRLSLPRRHSALIAERDGSVTLFVPEKLSKKDLEHLHQIPEVASRELLPGIGARIAEATRSAAVRGAQHDVRSGEIAAFIERIHHTRPFPPRFGITIGRRRVRVEYANAELKVRGLRGRRGVITGQREDASLQDESGASMVEVLMRHRVAQARRSVVAGLVEISPSVVVIRADYLGRKDPEIGALMRDQVRKAGLAATAAEGGGSAITRVVVEGSPEAVKEWTDLDSEFFVTRVPAGLENAARAYLTGKRDPFLEKPTGQGRDPSENASDTPTARSRNDRWIVVDERPLDARESVFDFGSLAGFAWAASQLKDGTDPALGALFDFYRTLRKDGAAVKLEDFWDILTDPALAARNAIEPFAWMALAEALRCYEMIRKTSARAA
ncbi:MAG: sigma-70 family RNA polymerase sigma factor, partial [Candidatus Omnitrophica bacterium]|nr:sigma-70 family RNA polymerase sigma factor [Candidatus Omnitrophota bacterium]